ncbi:methyltransferase family protein [Mycobacterium sp.]|uniref:methyltransferase family protein n=1 Tax=Mycobacterium sp. TaxID=1785 RepID=UPI003C71E2C5
MSEGELDPSHIMAVGAGFWASKTLLSAVELGLFTLLDAEPLTAAQVDKGLGLHPRAI